jgi:hypothetical protein
MDEIRRHLSTCGFQSISGTKEQLVNILRNLIKIERGKRAKSGHGSDGVEDSDSEQDYESESDQDICSEVDCDDVGRDASEDCVSVTSGRFSPDSCSGHSMRLQEIDS